MPSLEISVFVRYFLGILFGSVIVKICIVAAEYVIWSRKISNNIPGMKGRFFNILGAVSYLPLTAKSRNGFSFLVYAHQLFLGLSNYFVQEKLYHLYLFIYPVVVLAKADAVQVVFSSSEAIEKPWFYKCLEPFLGAGLFTSGGNMWRCRRRFLNSCFHKNILNEHFLVLQEHANMLVETLKKEIQEDFTKINKPISEYTTNAIHEIAFGAPEAKNSSEFRNFIYANKWGMRLIAERGSNCFLWLDFIYFLTKKGKETKQHAKTVKDFIKKKIHEGKLKYLQSDYDTKAEKGRTLLNILLEIHFQRSDFSEKDLSDELNTFLLAGQDTTSVAISWTLYILGLYPEIQTKVHEELDFIFEGDPERNMTLHDLNEMKYLKRVMKETLRLYPPVPGLARRLHKDMNICGYHVPKGTTCLAFMTALHRDEKVFPDAERFDPDRFLPENSRSRSHYAYLPFSVGPRNCIGQNLAMMNQMVAISTLLRNYKLESLDQRDKLLLTLTITTTPSKPIRIRIRTRTSNTI